MSVQIAIMIGYSNLYPPTVYKLLGQHYAKQTYRVDCEMGESRHAAYEFNEGSMQAEDLAVRLSMRHHVPLAVGIVAVRLGGGRSPFRPTNLEIAVFVERGELKEPIPLTPHTTHNAACAPWGKHPNESHFNTEAGLNLIEAIRVRHRSLHLV